MPADSLIAADQKEVSGETLAPLKKPQAVLDLEAAGIGVETNSEEKQAAYGSPSMNNLGQKTTAPPSTTFFRWFFLVAISLLVMVGLTADAFYTSLPYKWMGLILTAVTAVLLVTTAKILKLSTRAGLSAALASFLLFTTALYGPRETIFHSIPTALPYAAILSLAWLWLLVAIVSIFKNYKPVLITFLLLLAYGALGPLMALVTGLMANYKVFSLAALNTSPAFISTHTPWFLWPMTVFLIFLLPLAVLCTFGYLWQNIKRGGGQYGGNIFLALSFIGLMLFGFLSFEQAIKGQAKWAQTLRGVYPPALTWLMAQKPLDVDDFISPEGGEWTIVTTDPLEPKTPFPLDEHEGNKHESNEHEDFVDHTPP
ncbi:MAG: hypothetical protein ACRCTY_07565, partial [Candidatus Adiutrix sp.]